MKKIFDERFFRLFIKSLIIFGIIGIILVGIIFYAIAVHHDGIDYDALKMEFSSVVYSTNAEGEISEFEQISGSQNRIWCDVEDMPQHLLDAFVAIEDERFYKHSGIDFKRTARATLNYLIKRDTSFGGSTINQQLVKNITGNDDRSPRRKVIEMIKAFDMDKKLSKTEILELYANTIYLSQGCYGVKTAADKYFGKEVKDLTIAEAASIAGITQYPTRYDPILNPDNNKEKQNLVLSKMYELEMISKEEYEEAVAEKLNIQNNDVNSENVYSQSWYTDMLVEQVKKDLQEKLSVSESIAIRMIYGGGLKIYSTLDPDIQRAAETVYENPSKYIRYDEKNPIESAIVVIDQSNGYVKAVAGGLGKKRENRILNRAVGTYRQPGSTIKPLSVYTPGFEYKLFTPDTMFIDEAIDVGSHTIKNYYLGYKGPVSTRYAVQQSINTVAVEAVKKVGLSRSYNFMIDRFGFTTLTEADMNISPLALGGLTNGVSVYEMTAAYATIASNGIYNVPITYTRVEDQNGKVLLEKKPNGHQAISPKAANTMLSCLRSVVEAGTGGQAAFSSMPVAGKTGTTDDDKDRWFMGFSPYYTAGVWVGYDQPKQITGYGSNPALILWRAVMKEAHKDLKVKPFTMVAGVVHKNDSAPEQELIEICADSGLLATPICQADYRGSRVKAELLSEEETPTETCAIHQYVSVDTSTGMIANPNCPMSLVETRAQTISEEMVVCNQH